MQHLWNIMMNLSENVRTGSGGPRRVKDSTPSTSQRCVLLLYPEKKFEGDCDDATMEMLTGCKHELMRASSPLRQGVRIAIENGRCKLIPKHPDELPGNRNSTMGSFSRMHPIHGNFLTRST